MTVCVFIYLLAIIIPKKIPTKLCGHPYSLFMGSKHSPSLSLSLHTILFSVTYPLHAMAWRKATNVVLCFCLSHTKRRTRRVPKNLHHPPTTKQQLHEQTTHLLPMEMEHIYVYMSMSYIHNTSFFLL